MKFADFNGKSKLKHRLNGKDTDLFGQNLGSNPSDLGDMSALSKFYSSIVQWLERWLDKPETNVQLILEEPLNLKQSGPYMHSSLLFERKLPNWRL